LKGSIVMVVVSGARFGPYEVNPQLADYRMSYQMIARSMSW